MKRDDITLIAMVVVVAATLSFIVSSKIFNYSSKADQVPVVGAISSTLPDPYHDPTYTAIFNSKAIDPTQLAHIGSQNNTSPFRGSQ